MTIQKSKDPVWLDHKGQKVPREYVAKDDMKKELKIGKLLKTAENLNARLAAFKRLAFAEVDAMYYEMLKEANIEPGERKGNFMLYNFDKSVKINIDVTDRIEFDENIGFAQEKINQFLNEKIAGTDPDLVTLINAAFTTRKTRLDTKRIFQLFTLNIKNLLWLEAMELIKKSIQTNESVRYMAFYTRTNGDKYDLLNLNFSNI